MALLMITVSLRADASAYAEIVKERDSVLSKIVAEVDARYYVGTADDDAVFSAKLALLSFRRDVAPTSSEKLKQQEQIIALQEKRLSALNARSHAGLANTLDVLRANDALLAAKQLLAEIQPDAKKG
jgi:hypothetical protein